MPRQADLRRVILRLALGHGGPGEPRGELKMMIEMTLGAGYGAFAAGAFGGGPRLLSDHEIALVGGGYLPDEVPYIQIGVGGAMVVAGGIITYGAIGAAAVTVGVFLGPALIVGGGCLAIYGL